MKNKNIVFIVFLLMQNIGLSQFFSQDYSADFNIFNKPDSVKSLNIEKINDSIIEILPYLKRLENFTINSEFDTIEIPNEIYTLIELKRLHIEGCFYSLSSEIKNLSNLIFLEIRNSNEKNPLPKEINELQNLKSLEIYGLDTVIPEICELNNLTYLKLYGSYKSLPESIGDLENLRCLRIMSPNLKELPKSFKKLKNLEELHIEFCFQEQIPKEICKLKKIKILQILFSSQIETCPKCISKLKNIKRIVIFPNSFSKEQKEEIKSWFEGSDVKISL